MFKSSQKLSLVTAFFVVVALTGCPDDKTSGQAPPEIVSATKQNYTRGIGGGHGTIYKVKIAAPPTDTIWVDSVWIGKNAVEFELQSKRSLADFILPSDTALLIARTFREDPNEKIPPPPPPPGSNGNNEKPQPTKQEGSPPPKSYEGAALLKLSNSKRSFLLTVSGFEKEEDMVTE